MVCGRILVRSLAVVCSVSTVIASSPAQRTFSPLAVYLEEGFNGGGIPSGWTLTQIGGLGGTWSVVAVGTSPLVAPYEGSGMAKYNSYDAPNGAEARFVAPAVNLASALDPFVGLVMYHDPEYTGFADSVYVEVSMGDSVNGPWTTLYGFQRPRLSGGWSREAVSLSPVNGAQRVFVGLRGVSKYGNNLYVDAFRIADTSFHDIGLTAILHGGSASFPSIAPRGVNPSRTSRHEQVIDSQEKAIATPAAMGVRGVNDLTVKVKNFGTYAEPAYVVKWQLDGQMQAPVGSSRTLNKNGSDTLVLNWSNPSPGRHLIAAWTSVPSDLNHANDTVRLAVRVLDSNVVFYEGFEGLTFPPAGWSVVNRDGGVLSPWFMGSSTSAFLPYEGNGFAGDNFQRSNGSYLDDYLITPPLSGAGRTAYIDSLLFWARSAYDAPPAPSYPDSLTVLLSSGGPDTASFSILLDDFEVSKAGWERRGYRLTGRIPENSTVYAAFRYLHYAAGDSGRNSNFIGIDDVEFSRSLLTSIKEVVLPGVFALYQNFPNPFNPTTVISYSVPPMAGRDLVSTDGRDGQLPVVSDVKVAVFDVLGRELTVLVNGRKEPGSYTVHFNASGLASGVYFYRLQTKSFVQTKKMLLLR